MKPISTCTVDDLLKHINGIVKEDDPKKWYVTIDEQTQTIELIDPETLEIHGIEAYQIYYMATHKNKD